MRYISSTWDRMILCKTPVRLGQELYVDEVFLPFIIHHDSHGFIICRVLCGMLGGSVVLQVHGQNPLDISRRGGLRQGVSLCDLPDPFLVVMFLLTLLSPRRGSVEPRYSADFLGLFLSRRQRQHQHDQGKYGSLAHWQSMQTH